MTRLYCAALLIAIGAADGAFAASVEMAPPQKASPSIIYLGTPAPAEKPDVQPASAAAGAPALDYPTNPPAELAAIKFPASGTQISASVIALGEPGVEVMKVAAVPKKSSRPADPVVLRGGVWGDGSAAPAEVALPSKPDAKQPDAAPADAHKEASASPQTPHEPPAAPAPPPPAAAAPKPQAMPAPGVGSVQ